MLCILYLVSVYEIRCTWTSSIIYIFSISMASNLTTCNWRHELEIQILSLWMSENFTRTNQNSVQYKELMYEISTLNDILVKFPFKWNQNEKLKSLRNRFRRDYYKCCLPFRVCSARKSVQCNLLRASSIKMISTQ